ncbi:MAG: response regulator transcription factor [Clostridia bacterium]|nr:response regulator transcription factor [Clostridia bacterium]
MENVQRKILIAEDNVELSDMLRNYLTRAGHVVYQAFDGMQAIDLLNALPVDLLVLDIMMPRADGYTVIKTLRQTKNIPIIITSAKATEEDKERMFDLGADDYMTKPFSFKEAVMRVNAQLRRYYDFNKVAPTKKDSARTLGTLSINPERFEAKAGGTMLSLSNKEFTLLDVLTSEPDRIFSKSQLLDKVWGTEDYIDENTVAVTVARLREKLLKHNVKNIVTVWGFGYKWES